jgi:hypothetical protein
LFFATVTLSLHIGTVLDVTADAPTFTEIELKFVTSLIVAVKQGSTKLKVPVVAVDHTAPSSVAFTEMVQTPAFDNTSDAANVNVLPESVIKVLQGAGGVTVI